LGHKFHRGASASNVWLVYDRSKEQDVTEFYRELQEESLAHGLNLPVSPTLKPADAERQPEFLSALSGAHDAELVISFGTLNDNELYEGLKRELLIKHGTLSQHITFDNTIDRIKDYESRGYTVGIKAILANLAMQICAKLGGAPWAFESPIYNESWPIIGIDIARLSRNSDVV